MGERASIRITHPSSVEPIWFYTHWHGDLLPHTVKEAITRCDMAGRITDYAYATRIIFDTLTELGSSREIGFGIMIGTELPDSNWEPVLIDWNESFQPIEFRGQRDGHPTITYFSKTAWWDEYVPAEPEMIIY